MLQICATLGSVTNPPSMEPSIIYTRRFRIVLYAWEMFLFLIIDQIFDVYRKYMKYHAIYIGNTHKSTSNNKTEF